MDKKQYDPERFKKLMMHPVFVMHDSNTKVIRAQLFFLSISLSFLSTSSINLSKQSSVLGIGIEGLELDHLLLVISAVVVYQLIHFVWVSWESFAEWKLRLTALDTGGWGGGGISIAAEDEDTKVRQTTLYAYIVDIFDHTLSSGDKDKAIEDVTKMLADSRIEDALARFDDSFKMFCRMQNIRWLVIEFGLPLLLGIISLYFAAKKYGVFDCVAAN